MTRLWSTGWWLTSVGAVALLMLVSAEGAAAATVMRAGPVSDLVVGVSVPAAAEGRT